MKSSIKVVMIVAVTSVLACGVGAVAGIGIYRLTQKEHSLLAPPSSIVSLPADSDYGVLISDVVEGSPAAQAGISRGAVILEVNGQPLVAAADLYRLLRRSRPGEEMTIAWSWGQEQREARLRLAEHNGQAFLGVAVCTQTLGAWEWDTAAPLLDIPTPLGFELPDYVRGPLRLGGAVVEAVVPGSPAEAAGIEEGDVIIEIDGEPVRAPWEVSEIVRGQQPGARITVIVQRSPEGKVALEVELGVSPDAEEAAYLGVVMSPYLLLGFEGREGDGAE